MPPKSLPQDSTDWTGPFSLVKDQLLGQTKYNRHVPAWNVKLLGEKSLIEKLNYEIK
jgi:hypothetical protein